MFMKDGGGVKKRLHVATFVLVSFSCRTSSIKLFISKLIQVLLSIKESIPQSNHINVTSVVNNVLLALITKENILDGIDSAVDVLKNVVLCMADSYKQATGNVKQADLICNLLTGCLEGVSCLQKGASEGKELFLL